MKKTSGSLSQFLKDSRMKANLSQKNVADRLGYTSAQFISNWERGVSNPPMKTVKRLASLYGVSPERLYEVLLRDTLAHVENDLYRSFFGTKSTANKR